VSAPRIHLTRHARAVLAVFAPILAAAAFIIPVYGYIEQRNRLDAEDQREMIAKEVAFHADELQRRIDRSVAVPAIVGAIVRQRGRLQDFEAIAAEIMRAVPALDALQLAPDGVVTQCYPLVGNEKAIGLNLLADRSRRRDAMRAVHDRRLVITAPMDLVQGGRGLVARLPVFVSRDAAAERFWGFVVALIRMDNMRISPLLDRSFTENYHFTVSHLAPGRSEEKIVYASGTSPLVDPLISPVRLSSGDVFVLRAEPKFGWPQRRGMTADLLLAAIAGLLLAAFTHYLMRRPAELQAQVDARTRELAEANDRLEGEVIERRRSDEALRRSEAFLDSVVENLPSMVFVKDSATLGFVRFNRAAEELLGRSRAELIGKTDHDLWPRAQADFFTARDREVLESGKLLDSPCEEIDTFAKGRRLLHTRKVPINGPDGKPLYLLGIAEDITETRHTQHRLRLASHVFEHSTEGIMITDADCRILLVNKAFESTTGYETAEAIGQTPHLLRSGMHGAEFYRAMWDSIMANGEWHGEIVNRRKNGEQYPEWLTISVIRNESGEITNYVAVFSDLTQRKQVEDKLNFLAYYDTLTGLPNRMLFTDRLTHALTQAQQSSMHVAVVFLDLDRFKRVNETLGHKAGDELLRTVSQRLLGCIRGGDSASRLGGDAFSIVLTDLSTPHDAAVIADKVLRELSRPITLDDNEIVISASLGISVYPDDGRDAETLVKNADSAMYQAAASGSGTYRFYTHDMNARSAERLSLEGRLRHALERGELRLHYQPLVSATDSRIVGAEALLRWQREEGTVNPVAFVPLLEETGLIIPVGEWVLRAACEHLKRWRLAGFADLVCAVNFSVQQFRHPGVLHVIRTVLDDVGIPPDAIELELTESMLMSDPETSASRMKAIKDMGLRLAIDDFGTGYSSLNYLRRFPIDTLKIDRSFVQDAPHDGNAGAIVEAIIGISRSLRLGTVAEGVETAKQAMYLREEHCDVMQGFHFAHPMPNEEFMAFLHRSRTIPLS